MTLLGPCGTKRILYVGINSFSHYILLAHESLNNKNLAFDYKPLLNINPNKNIGQQKVLQIVFQNRSHIKYQPEKLFSTE